MRKIFIFGLLIMLLVLAWAAVNGDFLSTPPAGGNDLNGSDPDHKQPDPGPEPEIRTATVAAVGDMFPHVTQLNQAHLGGDNYDFSPSFEFIAPYFQAADFAMLNLETCFAGAEKTYGGYELGFNTPIQLSLALKEAGIDLYATATNHALDRGLSGLQATLENVRALGFITTGTYLSPEERDTPVIVPINGINVAFISYTYGSNIAVPAGHEYCLNLTPDFRDISPIIADIKSARAVGADIITVLPHWGGMYVFEPTQQLREAAAEFAAAGADLVIAGHAHVVQPMEWIYTEEENGSRRPTLVAYSLGNFFTNQHYPALHTDMVEYGLLLNIELTKNMDTNEAWVSDVDYEVHWCHFRWRHRLLVLTEVFEQGPENYNLTASQLEQLKDRYRKNVEIVERYGFSENKPWDRAVDH